jgi:hypothetical protein
MWLVKEVAYVIKTFSFNDLFLYLGRRIMFRQIKLKFHFDYVSQIFQTIQELFLLKFNSFYFVLRIFHFI